MSKQFNPELIDFEYELLPLESMEWAVLDSKENEQINSTLKESFRDNFDMAERFYKILTKGNSVKYHKGHMIRLSKDYINRIMESGTL